MFVLEVLEWDGSHLQGSSREARDCPVLGLCNGGHVHIATARRVDDVNDLRLSLCCDLERTESRWPYILCCALEITDSKSNLLCVTKEHNTCICIKLFGAVHSPSAEVNHNFIKS